MVSRLFSHTLAQERWLMCSGNPSREGGVAAEKAPLLMGFVYAKWVCVCLLFGETKLMANLRYVRGEHVCLGFRKVVPHTLPRRLLTWLA